MGCPMKSKGQKVVRPSEYPFESLYRPWSWMLSSFNNILVFAILVGVIYVLYKRRKGNKKTVSFRVLNVSATNEDCDDGIVAVVTGGNGFVGKRLVRKLAQDEQYKVKPLDLWIPDEGSRTDGVLSYIQADITNYDDLVLAFKGADVVFHAVAVMPFAMGRSKSDFYRVNVRGTENVVNACKECGVKRLIYTSSVAATVSKDQPSVDLDETVPLPKNPINAYAATKGAAETLVRGANGSDGLLTCTLRPGKIVGGADNCVMNAMTSSTYVGDGTTKVTIVLIDDVIEALFLAEEKLRDEGEDSPVAGNVFYLGIEDELTERESMEFVAEQNGTSVHSLPQFVFILLAYFNVAVYFFIGKAPIDKILTIMTIDFVRSQTFSSALAHKHLGWQKQLPWKETLKKAIEQYHAETEAKKEK